MHGGVARPVLRCGMMLSCVIRDVVLMPDRRDTRLAEAVRRPTKWAELNFRRQVVTSCVADRYCWTTGGPNDNKWKTNWCERSLMTLKKKVKKQPKQTKNIKKPLVYSAANHIYSL